MTQFNVQNLNLYVNDANHFHIKCFIWFSQSLGTSFMMYALSGTRGIFYNKVSQMCKFTECRALSC